MEKYYCNRTLVRAMISIFELGAIRTIIRLIGLFVATVFPGILKALGTVGCFNGKWSTCLTSSWPGMVPENSVQGVSIDGFHNATGVIGRLEGRDIPYFSITFILPWVLLKIIKYGSTSISCFPCCCCSVAKSCLTLCNLMDCSTPGFPVLHHLPEFAQTHAHRVSDASNHLILCCPLLLWPSVFCLSQLIGWPKYWSFSFSISPSNEYSGLISSGIDWFDLFTIQGTLKSLLQDRSSKISILQYSAFFMVQLSHPYMTTGKVIALIIQLQNMCV